MRVKCVMFAAALGLTACGGENSNPNAGKSLETFEISGGPQRYIVNIFDQGSGRRQITVKSAGYRGLDRGEGELALRVASQAAERANCGNGKGVRILPETALYQDRNEGFSALSRGGNIWQFTGMCGG